MVYYFTPCGIGKSHCWTCNLILFQELMFYKFKQGHNAAEATKNICHTKDERAVYHSTVTRELKKFYKSWKNLDNLAKTVNSEAVFKAIEANPVSSFRRVSGELYPPIQWFVTFTNSAKASWATDFCLLLPKYCKAFDSPHYISSEWFFERNFYG